ncbi:MAG: flavodoxin family protein [Thermoplasmata archaeon]|nr:flavodoxin family protein [Thermoplasmata archaeon]
MKTIIVYDSLHGNTENIAKAIGAAIGGDVKVARVADVPPGDIVSADLVIVGSPTHGGRPTPAIQSTLNAVPDLRGKKAAAFDTRLGGRMVKMFGFAAPKINDLLIGKGATTVTPPEWFVVMKTAGPLKDGEIERAAAWANTLKSAAGR